METGTEKWVRYFERPGPVNTRTTLECCIRRARELGLKKVVVASPRDKPKYSPEGVGEEYR